MKRNKSNRKNSKKNLIICVLLISILLLVTFALIFGKSVIESFEKNFYPIKYSQEVNDACAEFNVPNYLIYAMIKTESNFKPDATSRVGAYGLMQLLPETYEWLAKKLGDTPNEDMISDPKTNIRYGTYYISTLMKRYGDIDLALCAYNAGPGRVDSWLSDTRYSSDGKTLSKIPYEETRSYVDKINKFINKYKELYGDN